MMFALLLQAEWYNFLHSTSWRSSWIWRMFIFDNYNGVEFIPIINFVSFLNHQCFRRANPVRTCLWMDSLTEIRFVTFICVTFRFSSRFLSCKNKISRLSSKEWLDNRDSDRPGPEFGVGKEVPSKTSNSESRKTFCKKKITKNNISKDI